MLLMWESQPPVIWWILNPSQPQYHYTSHVWWILNPSQPQTVSLHQSSGEYSIHPNHRLSQHQSHLVNTQSIPTTDCITTPIVCWILNPHLPQTITTPVIWWILNPHQPETVSLYQLSGEYSIHTYHRLSQHQSSGEYSIHPNHRLSQHQSSGEYSIHPNHRMYHYTICLVNTESTPTTVCITRPSGLVLGAVN